VAVIVL
jgi:histone H3/H4